MKKFFITLGMISVLCSVTLMACGNANDGKISSEHTGTSHYPSEHTSEYATNHTNMLESDLTELSTELANGATELSSRLAEGATDLSRDLSGTTMR